MKHKIISLPIAVSLLVIVGAIGLWQLSPAPIPEHSTPELTEIVVNNYYWDGQVQHTETQLDIGNKTTTEKTLDLLVVDMTIYNKSDVSISLDCVIVDSNKEVFGTFPSTKSISMSENLLAAILAPLKMKRGKRAFTVPKSSIGLSLHCGHDIVVKIN